MKISNLRNGFTLIELMVVVAIIGILLGLTLTSFEASKKASRDGKRKTDLAQIAAALEMYRADKGVYPKETLCSVDPDGGHGESVDNTGVFCNPGPLIPTYMSPIHDPIEGNAGPCHGSGNQCLYRSRMRTDRSGYVLEAYLETGDVFWQVCSEGKEGALPAPRPDDDGYCNL